MPTPWLQQTFSRIFPSRVWGLATPSLPPQYSGLDASWEKPLMGQSSQAMIIVPNRSVANSGFQITAGQNVLGAEGRHLSLTITVGSGALAVSSNELDISVVEASGGSTATAIIAAINAQFSSGLFVVAAKTAGSTGAGKPAALPITYFTTPHFPAPPNT